MSVQEYSLVIQTGQEGGTSSVYTPSSQTGPETGTTAGFTPTSQSGQEIDISVGFTPSQTGPEPDVTSGFALVPQSKPEKDDDDDDDDDDEIQQKEQTDDVDLLDTSCAFYGLRFNVLRPCAKISFFTAFYSLAGLVTSTLTVYLTSQVTTLERQFGFSSQQTGIIMAANDMGYLVCVLFISYSASRIHIPRSLGIATILFGLSGITCSLPHFIYGTSAGDVGASDVNVSMTGGASPGKTSMFGDLCDVFNSSQSSCVQVLDKTATQSGSSIQEDVAKSAFIIIVLGMMLQGFGKAPRHPLTLTYLDDNTSKVKTGFYMGIIVTISILGPAIAYLMGGYFSKIYVTLQPTNLTPRHPKWIGAWWLGYIVFGSIALLVSLPLFCFPKRMPRRAERRDSLIGRTIDGADNIKKTIAGPVQNKNERRTSLEKERGQPVRERKTLKQCSSFVLRHAGEFLTTLLRLCTNPIYLCMVVSGAVLIFTFGGTQAYFPKYIERMFHLETHVANYIVAGQTLCTSCLGAFAGGYLTKRLKMSAMGAMKFIIIVLGVSVSSYMMGFVFICDQQEVHNWPSNNNSCTDNCNCKDNSYFPVCGGDGKTYYSPCQAGCVEATNGAYHNCSCIAGGSAKPGTCDMTCSNLYGYVAFMGIRSLFGTLSMIPKLVVFIRCVGSKDRPLAIGFSSFTMSLVGWMLGPIVFGGIIDEVCTVWTVACEVRGRCLRYDNYQFMIKLHSYGGVGLLLSLFFLVVAFVYAWWTKCLDDVRENNKGERTIEMMLLSGKKDENDNEK